MVAAALLLLGFVVVVTGAEWLVRAASRIAERLGVSPVIIGLTVVAVGTSMPEAVTGLVAGFGGHGDIALGNVIGSNIFNVLFILGLVSIMRPLPVAQRVVRLDVPILIVISIVVTLMALDGTIGRIDGALLLTAFVAHSWMLFMSARRESAKVRAEYEAEFAGTTGTMTRDTWLLFLGGVMLVQGSRWVISGAVGIAQMLGISELVIGLTVIAAGTGMPELITSLVAARHDEPDIAVGNVVGSNVLNLLLVLGLIGFVVPGGIPVAPEAIRVDLPVMVGTAIVCWPIFLSGYVIQRWQGAVLFGYYCTYTAFLVLNAQQHDALPIFGTTVLGFVIPLTLVAVVASAVRDRRS